MTTLTLLENGRIRTQEDNGRTTEIGPEHPDYQRLAANYRSSLRPTLRSRLTAIAFILAGAGAWWYVWHQLVTEGAYSLRLSLVGPFGVFGGFFLLVRPQWSGPWRSDTPTAQKAGTIAMIAVILAALGIYYYLMQNYRAVR